MKKILLPLVILIYSCSTIQRDNSEQEIRSCIASFHYSLSSTDDEILKRFSTDQSRKAILEVIRILQNKDSLVTCTLDINNMVIEVGDKDVNVKIPTSLQVIDKKPVQTTLTLWLEKTGKQFMIVLVDGEKLWMEYQELIHEDDWEKERRLALESRKVVYNQAQQLEQTFDSVIWYTKYRDTTYFYVVSGEWNNYFLNWKTENEKNLNTKMGLVDAAGDTIIPIEYSLIGTISFDHDGMVEVKKDDKVGYYDIVAKKLIIDPVYDMIIPYKKDSIFSIVKSDTVYGWLNTAYEYREGFPSQEAEEWIRGFVFLTRQFFFNTDSHLYGEIPNQNEIGNGILIFPSYLTNYSLFPEIQAGISTTSIPIHGWKSYIETRPTILERVTDSFSALMTTIRTGYLEGREEFYDRSQLTFVDAKNDTLGTLTIDGHAVSFKLMDSLLEVRTTPPYDYYYGDIDVDELDLYRYYKLSSSSQITKLKSKRFFDQTEFVKLDSSYMYWESSPMEDLKKPISLKTLFFMRNQILNEYGYRFTPEDQAEPFTNDSDYNPKYNTIEELEDRLTDIDKHNIRFLNEEINKRKLSI